jgi:mono/diheme cytochrome c family protein
VQAAAPVSSPPTPAQIEFFEKNIRPLLAESCFKCHGPDKQKGGLRLDSRADLLKGGDSGPAIVPGKPAESLLLKAVSYQQELRMPPKEKLDQAQLALLARWITDGAPWPATATEIRPITPGKEFRITDKDRAFWSFQPVANPTLPTVRDAGWVQTSVDRFILARLEAAGKQHAAAADRSTLIRRVSFDLIGLPPAPEEVDAFVADQRPDAYERLVDRLLASPHYGERWARHWLDLARYGEDQAHTFQARKYPNGYRYRDWLVQAFNSDLPYDRFIKEQLAADVLELPDRQANLAALGFFALGPVYYGDPKKLDQYDDRVDTLTRGLLGLTVACARCHDHKFDPISQKDYYGLAGIFASTEYVEAPLVSAEEVEAAKKTWTDADRKKNVPPPYPVVHALKEGTPTNLRVLIRGNPNTPSDEAPRRFLAILNLEPKPFARGSGRLELAEAIASKDNPLTARVMVNRIWQHHFGKGLVRTASNFGSLGEKPSHPELLDHLATRFVQSGWSIKALHREIVLSATYRQTSRVDAVQRASDPENTLLGRMVPRRLEVEAWRDAMLAVSGRLDEQQGGPSRELTQGDNRRRTLYGSVSRHELNSLLRLFDFPDPNVPTGGRVVTTVPLQQLFVLNSEFMVNNARTLAARLTKAGATDEARVRQAFRIVYGRTVTEPELRLGLAFLAAPEPAGQPAKLTRWEQYAQVLLAANEFLYVD